MATRASVRKGVSAPIQIRAQFLRDYPAQTPGPMSGFALIPEEDALQPVPSVARGKGRWQQKDVARALEAARQAGLGAFRVEIAPDGTISIVVGEREADAA